MAEILNGWMEFRVWGWLGSCRKYGRLTPLPVKPELMAHQPMGGKGGPQRERGGQIGYQIGWNLKVWLSGKREAGGRIGVLQFYIQRICTRTEEGLEPKIHYLPTKPYPPL